MGMSKEAKQARKEYMRKYREENKEEYNEYMRKWRKKNPDKVKEYNKRHWEKKAEEMQQKADFIVRLFSLMFFNNYLQNGTGGKRVA